MKKSLVFSLMVLSVAWTGVSHAQSINESITFSGHAVLGARVFDNQNQIAENSGVDAKANLAATIVINEKLTAVIEAFPQTGTAAAMDVHMSYEWSDKTTVIGGVYNFPLGQQEAYLSNWADYSANALILNPAFYDLLAGDRSPLGAVGILLTQSGPFGTVDLGLSNGTSGTTQNNDGAMISALRWVSPSFKGLSLGISGLTGAEQTVQKTRHEEGVSSEGFEGDISAWMLDLHGNWGETAAKVFVAGFQLENRLTGGDKIDAAVSGVGIELSHKIGKTVIAGRLSSVSYDDHYENSGLTAALISPEVISTAVDYTRYEVGVSYHSSETVTLKSELFLESFEKDFKDELGVLSYIEVTF